MTTTRPTLIVSLLATLVTSNAAAEPIFASPPHFVAAGDGQRIVLFLNEPLTTRVLVGGGLVIAGVAFTAKSRY